MESKKTNFIPILIGLGLILVLGGIALLIFIGSSSKSTKSNTVANDFASNTAVNSNNTSENDSSKNVSTLPEKNDYISGKRSFIDDRINDNNCDTPQPLSQSSCNTYKHIKSILNNVSKEDDLSLDFREKCLNQLKESGNGALLTNPCQQLINNNKAIEIKAGEANNTGQIKEGEVGSKNIQTDLSNKGLADLTNKINDQKGSIDNLAKSIAEESNNQSLNYKINSLDNRITHLTYALLFLIFLILGLLISQIWLLLGNRYLLTLSSRIKEISKEINHKLGVDVGGINVNVFQKISSLKDILSNLDTSFDKGGQTNTNIPLPHNDSTNEITEIPTDMGRSNNTFETESSNTTEYTEQEEVTQPKVNRELLRGLVSDIVDNFSIKTELTKSPYAETLKTITSATETVYYYGIALKEGDGQKLYVIPAVTNINSASESRILTDFYTFNKSETSGLNGKLKIEIPAEVVRSEKTDGWKLDKKGLIKIVS